MESSPETIYIGHLTCLIPDTRDEAIWVSLMAVAGNIDPFPESTLTDTGTPGAKLTVFWQVYIY